MEIVHVVRQYRPSVGGLEDAVQNLCHHLAQKEGIKVRIVTLDRVFTNPLKILPRHEIIDGIEVTRLSYFGSSRYPIALGILKEIRSATLVHVHAIDFFFDYLALTKFIHKKPLVASTHGGFFHSSFATRLKKIYFQSVTRLSATAYDMICCSSDNDAATFGRTASAKKIITIENGVNIDKWKDLASPTPLRTMIFIGRWSANKAIPVLIDLLASLKKHGRAWKLIVTGIAGSDTKASLEEYAANLGIYDQLTIVEGPSEAEIGALIGQSTFIASASRYEGFGISAVEGLSAGLIPLLSPIPPFEKLQKSLSLGSIIDEKDIDRSAGNIESTFQVLSASESSARSQSISLAEKYDWRGATQRFLKVYKAVLSKTNESGRL